jgi:hypothetical protein
MARSAYRTNHLGWVLASACVFAALSFIDLFAGVAKGDCSLWGQLAVLFRGEYICDTTEVLGGVVLWTAILAVPAVLIGWLIQAVIVVAQARTSSGPAKSPQSDTPG